MFHRRPRRAAAIATMVAVLAVDLYVGGASQPAAALTPGVTITSSQVNVRTVGAGVTLSRNPVRLTFQDNNNTTVLSGHAAPSSPINRSVNMNSHMPNPASYAPLTFIVGTRSMNQSSWGFYMGQVEKDWFGSTGSISGREYGPTGVVSATQQGSGARVVLSTSDPSGRQMYLDLQPGADAASVTVNVSFSSTANVVAVSDSFTSTSTEAFRGFGGRHNGLNQRGKSFYNWVEMENDETDTTSKNLSPSPAGELAAYYVQPSFLSSHNYGFLVDQYEMSSFRLASDNAAKWQTSVAADRLRYVVAPGTAKTAITSLTSYTGRNDVPPMWALGAIEGEMSGSVEGCDAVCYQGKMDDTLARIDQYDVPLTGFVIDQPWYLDELGVLPYYTDQLRQRGIHPMSYLKTFLTDYDIGFDNTYHLGEARDLGYLIRDGFGNPTNYVDFTNPAAAQWWQDLIKEHLDLGFDGFMQDFGEAVVNDWQFHDGSRGAFMHNRYPVLYSQVTREALDEYEAENPGRELWVFARSGYTGSAAFEGGTFGGDNRSSWGRANGIGSVTSDMLNRGLGGATVYTTDIGGYWDNEDTSKELFLRWAQLAALSPVFRTHNGFYDGAYHSWDYDSEAITVFNDAAALHIRASGYISDLLEQSQSTGVPAARPLWMEYPNDATAAQQDQQWLLGTDVLVAPVVTRGATSRSVYFPSGCWRDPTTGQQLQGPTTATVQAPITKLPYYFKCGTNPF